MRYIHTLLLPDERVLYSGKVHWIIYAPGIFLCLLALLVADYSRTLGITLPGAPALPYHWDLPFLSDINYFISRHYFALMQSMPSLRYVPASLTILLFLWGTYSLTRAYVVAHYTELVVTDRRVVAKYGFTNITTMEIDRYKIAGVTIHQTALGRVLNYGRINLRGFSGYIAGLPAIAAPHELQKQVNRRERW